MDTPPPANRPYSAVFSEHYWSGGAAEKSHVFLQGNHLPQRLPTAQTFTVAELGFGTGLNALLTLHLWQQQAMSGSNLTYISYEQYPLSPAELLSIHTMFPPQLASLSATFLAAYNPVSGWNHLTIGNATLLLYVGDAATGLATHPQPADAWFLDGFSPARNPELWQPSLMQQVYANTVPGGTASTYSVARIVRDSLTAAGFYIEKRPGFPPKGDMLAASKKAP